MKNETIQSKEKVFSSDDMSLILEKVDDSVKILAEGHAALVKGQNEIKKTLVNMDQRLGKVEIKLESVDNRLGLVETKIDRLQDDMVEVKFDLKRKVDAEQFERLEKRVVKLEKLSCTH